VRALSANAPTPNVWTHLTAVHDAAADTMTLYVDGVAQGTATFSGAWASHGALAIGRALYGGVKVDYFAGQISDVRVTNSALTAAQVGGVYTDTAPVTQLS
jgi:hypothetical protein